MNTNAYLHSTLEGRIHVALIWPPAPAAVRHPEECRPGDFEESACRPRFGGGLGGIPSRLTPEGQASLFAILKQHLLLQFLDGVADHAAHNLIINEANASARLVALAGFPMLFFPCLFAERASEALAHHRRRSNDYWGGIVSQREESDLGSFEASSRELCPARDRKFQKTPGLDHHETILHS